WHRPWGAIDLSGLVRLRYFDETYVDLVALLALLTEQVGADRADFQRFIQFLGQALDYLPNPRPTQFIDFSRVYVLQHGAEINALYGDYLSGLSLHVPGTAQQLQANIRSGLYGELTLPVLLQRLWQAGHLSS
ncbi:MAG: hypothetical protein AAFU71_17630, partial [Cyanobacteria bacterium J06632_22]